MKNIKLSNIYLKIINEALTSADVSDESMDEDVEKMIDWLDFPVRRGDLKNAYNTLLKYANANKALDFIDLYNNSGLAKTNMKNDVSSSYMTSVEGSRLQKQLIQLIDTIESGKSISSNGDDIAIGGETSDNDLNKINFKFGENKPTPIENDDEKIRRKEPNYRDCSKLTDNIEYGCINPMVAEIQKCLGITPTMGYFGPKTRRVLGRDTITRKMYDDIMSDCNKSNNSSEEPVKPTEKIPTMDDLLALSLKLKYYRELTPEELEIYKKYSYRFENDPKPINA
jgi:hypothetical protein